VYAVKVVALENDVRSLRSVKVVAGKQEKVSADYFDLRRKLKSFPKTL